MTRVLAATVFTLSITLTACGVASPTGAVPQATAAITIQPSPGSVPAPSPTHPTVILSERNQAAFRAIVTAEREVGGTAIEIDSDYKRWEVDVVVDWTEHELDISPDGNSVLRNENSDADTDDFRRLGAVSMYMIEATMLALSTTPGDIAEVSLQTVNGTVVWDVTIEQNTDGFAYVRVNAATGEVLR